MNFIWSHILTVITFLPILGALLILGMPQENKRLIRVTAMAVMTVDFLLSLPLFFSFNGGTAMMQFTESYEWVFLILSESTGSRYCFLC